MNDKNNDSETLSVRQQSFLSDIAMVLPGAIATLPLAQLEVLKKAACIFIQLYAKEHSQNGGVNCEFHLKVQKSQITHGRMHIDGTTTVVLPDTKWVTTHE